MITDKRLLSLSLRLVVKKEDELFGVSIRENEKNFYRSFSPGKRKIFLPEYQSSKI